MIEWNKIIYDDCLNEINGLPYLANLIEDKEIEKIDLCLTDPPFNVKYTGNRITSKKIVIFEDNKEEKEYFAWCKLWFELLERICNTIIFTPGNPNLHFWYNYKKPVDLGIHYKKNSATRASAAYFAGYESILFYGKFGKKRVKQLVFQHLVQHTKFIHSDPKNYYLWYDIINQFKPYSVIDPFIGSGTTAEVCLRLGIPYIGYEINPIYKQDMDLRLNKGISCVKSPRNINYWFKNEER
ncbi:hypothetical protein LCGC14_1151930 [marine sediment metagenome]|uniref:DNA methylase N-4/N-6 domain-containing protein n=1 Tax=marine sediment metagenome TaxID=412755 RepID=A0A0F9Q0S2_9ZZZZ